MPPVLAAIALAATVIAPALQTYFGRLPVFVLFGQTLVLQVLSGLKTEGKQ